MGNIVTTCAWLREYGLAKYAQYERAPFLRFTPKRKKQGRVWHGTGYHPFALVVKGWDAPESAGLFDGGKRNDSGPLPMVQTKYSSFDSGWEKDFNAIINPLIEAGEVEVVVDFREMKE